MGLQKQRQQGLVTKSLKSKLRATRKANKRASSNKKTNPKITLKDQMGNRSIFKDGGLPENTLVFYRSDGKTLLKGHKEGQRILCHCCQSQMSPSQFEAHAGMGRRKKPYENIFLANGVSLHDYASNLKLDRKDPLAKEHDQVCTVCKRGGDLLPCDGCPRSFHKECTSESRIHEKKWFCENCRKSMKCAGRNAIQQIAKQRIQIVHNPDEHDIVACVLCRTCDFNENGFDDRTVIVCDQCEKEYHIGCMREKRIADLKELPHDNWFCMDDCKKLHSALDAMVTAGPKKVPESFIDMIRKRSENRDTGSISDSNVNWILIRGKDASAENRMLLTEAVNMFHDGFSPIIDSLTGSDFIPSMAYGLKMGALDFAGVHCALLTINSKAVTAGMFRVFGQELAELPIVATSQSHQGKGYFRLFFSYFEQLLSFLRVKKLLVPAAHDARAMWIKKFGLRTVTQIDLNEYRQTQTSMVDFQGTTLLQKKVPYPNESMFRLLDFV